MKVAIVSENPEAFREQIERAGHVICGYARSLDYLANLIAKHCPHLVVLDGQDISLFAMDKLGPLFPNLRFVHIPDGSDERARRRLSVALRKGVVQAEYPADLPQQRQIFVAKEFHEIEGNGEVCGQPSEEVIASEELRLFWLLHTTRKNFKAAKSYWDTIRSQEPTEIQEHICRLCEGNFLASAFARQQIARYVGFLAHSVAGAELEYLPAPADPNSPYSFAHFNPSIEMLYASLVISTIGYNQLLAEPLMEAFLWRHDFEDPGVTVAASLRTLGLSQGFRGIASAHFLATSWMLDPASLQKLDQDHPRMLRIGLKTFADFWQLTHVVQAADRLRSVLNLIIDTDCTLPVPQQLMPPTYKQFAESLSEAHSEENK